MKTPRFRGLFVGIMSLAILVSTGCTVDVGTAARSSLSSFLTTLASTAINSVINQQ